MRRRTFFGGALAGTLSPAAGVAAKAGDIPKRKFGNTGEMLTIIGPAGGRLSMISFEEAKAVIRRAYDLGINYYDNAAAYGNGRSEEIFGAVIPEFRKQIFLTTKSAKRTRQGAEEDLHASLRRMKTDYIDLWQIHQVGEMEEVDQIFAPGGAIEAFEAAKKAGKCRYIGFTGHRDPKVHLEMLKRYDKYDTILMPLNIADSAYLSFEKDVLPEAVRRGMGIQAMKSTANAKLLSRFAVADCLQYTLSLPIHCLAVGCTTIGQLEDDVRIAKAFRPLTSERMQELRAMARKIAVPGFEDWKRKPQQASAGWDLHHDV